MYNFIERLKVWWNVLTKRIYWGAIAANSEDVNIGATIVFSVASSGFVMTKDNQK